MKLMGVKRNFQVLLVPNYHYRAFRITVIYVRFSESDVANVRLLSLVIAVGYPYTYTCVVAGSFYTKNSFIAKRSVYDRTLVNA